MQSSLNPSEGGGAKSLVYAIPNFAQQGLHNFCSLTMSQYL